MGKTILVSDRVNSFFTNNKIQAGTEIPTSGSYIKGDIIVNIGPTSASEPMWVCTEDGNPGTWGLVGVGGGSLVSINESVIVNTAASEVSLGSLSGLVSSKDKLLVHYNSAYLMEGIDYEISADATKIIKIGGGTWNSNNDPDSIFTFELLKSVESVDGDNIKIDSKLTSVTNNVVVTSPVTEVEIGIDGYNPNNDMLMVFKNSTFIVEGVDYEISADGSKIVSLNGVWNENVDADYIFTFVVFKEVATINPEAIVGTDDIVDGSVTMDKLSGDVKQAIEDASNIDLSGYQEKSDNSLVTTDKTIVGAINELFQNANNGKELIADAIGEPLTAEDTFSAMSSGINELTSSFKAALMNNGVSVESGDKFKALIEKLALLANSEGKGIKYAKLTGNWEIKSDQTTGSKIINIPMGLDFIPSEIICYFPSYSEYGFGGGAYFYNNSGQQNVIVTNNIPFINAQNSNSKMEISNISAESFDISNGFYTADGERYYFLRGTCTEIYAIGVGEEDTTLEDTLRDILTNKGVHVTEEDDLSSLINKVDNLCIPSGNAVASDVASGKTFINNTGQVITGTASAYLNVLENGGNSSKYVYTKNRDDNVIKLTHNTNYLNMNIKGWTGSTNNIYFNLNESFNLTNKTMILFDLSVSGDANYIHYNFGVYSGSGNFTATNQLVKYIKYTSEYKEQLAYHRAKYIVDVSSCTGIHKIGIYLDIYNTSASVNLNLYNIEIK